VGGATYALHDQSSISGLIVVIGRGWQWAVGRPTAAMTQGRCRIGVLGDGSQTGPIWKFGSEHNENQKKSQKQIENEKKGRQIVVDDGNEMGVGFPFGCSGCGWGVINGVFK